MWPAPSRQLASSLFLSTSFKTCRMLASDQPSPPHPTCSSTTVPSSSLLRASLRSYHYTTICEPQGIFGDGTVSLIRAWLSSAAFTLLSDSMVIWNMGRELIQALRWICPRIKCEWHTGFQVHLSHSKKISVLTIFKRICQVVKIGLIIALMINYGNQMHAAVEITEPTLNKRCDSKGKKMWAEIGVRTFILLSSGKL